MPTCAQYVALFTSSDFNGRYYIWLTEALQLIWMYIRHDQEKEQTIYLEWKAYTTSFLAVQQTWLLSQSLD